MLKSFESRGWIELGRGIIKLQERSLLGQLTHD